MICYRSKLLAVSSSLVRFQHSFEHLSLMSCQPCPSGPLKINLTWPMATCKRSGFLRLLALLACPCLHRCKRVVPGGLAAKQDVQGPPRPLHQAQVRPREATPSQGFDGLCTLSCHHHHGSAVCTIHY